MQDPMATAFQGAPKPQFPEPEHQQQQQLKCPRCDSTNTKFCYYNNYNLSQPRHFCKNCRRYWTKGGALRNIPIGGGSRKNSKRSNHPKRPSTSTATAAASDPPSNPQPEPVSTLYPHPPLDPDDRMLEITGSFSSLLQSTAHFGNFLEGFEPANDSSGSDNPPPPPPAADAPTTPLPENFLGLDSSCWTGAWPDLAIYTPGSGFQ